MNAIAMLNHNRNPKRLLAALFMLAACGSTVVAQEKVADTQFSIDRGFYAAATNLAISSETAAATITYTLDGSDPRTSTSAMSSTIPAMVPIDPGSSAGKWKATPAVMVRAYAHLAGMVPSNVDTHTYIFPSEVKVQGDIRPDGEYVFWESTEMDTDVVTDPAYSDELDEALTAIPSLSIVMDHEDLFGTEGIHRGDNLVKDWEMACSMELIYPATPRFTAFKGFQIDCGIKNQGGGGLWQNGEYDHKQSFGIRFRRQYGAGSLQYPFFEHAPLNADSAADRFDKLVLRAGHNKSYGIDYDVENTVYTRDQLARDLQIDMTGIGGHGSFVHLYLNGIYWGLYNPCERQDNAFAAHYLGGNEEDYYTGKGKGGDTAGVNTRFNEWLNTASSSSDPATLLDYCNIDNHADMCLINSYASVSDFPQYYYGMGNNPGGQVYFFNWDSEEAFEVNDEPFIQNLSLCMGFDNMWNNNAEYRMNFADRAYKASFNGGTLTDAHVLERWNTLCDTIYAAIICESARWGDERVNPPITRDNEWASARADVAAGTVGRADRLIAALIADGKYPALKPPLFKDGSTTINVARMEVTSGFNLSIDRDGASGTVYYTLDGTDPRATGGAAQGIDAGTGTSIAILSTTSVKARTLDGGTWSALHEVLFFVEQDRSGLKITEIMYHPQDQPMISGAALASIIGEASSIDPSHTNRAILEFSDTLPDALTGGDKVVLRGATHPANNGTFTIRRVIFDGSIGQTRTKKVLLTEPLTDENTSGMTGDFLSAGDRYEFVEIKNTGGSTLPLSGITFTRGINYTFPDGAELAPGGFAVLARNPWDFVQRYPAATPVGAFPASRLDNSGERVELALGTRIRHDVLSTVTTIDGNGAVILQAIPPGIGAGDRMQVSLSDHYCNNRMFTILSVLGNIVFVKEPLPTEPQGAKARFFDVITSVEYGDSSPWPLPADGYGFSLTPTHSNPAGSQDAADEWRASAHADGSPGADDPEPNVANIKVNEALTHTDQPQRDTIELYNPGAQPADIGGWYLTDDLEIPQKWTIPPGTLIPANGYWDFHEGHYVSTNLVFDADEFGSAFSLSAAGDEVYLFSPTLGYSHGFSFEGAFNGVAFGRHITSEGVEQFPSQIAPTPQAANAGPAIGSVILGEIMYHPADGGHEFIELENTGSSPVPLYDPSYPTNTWLVGGVDFQFPAGIVIEAGKTILLVRDTTTPAAFRAARNIATDVQIFSYTGKLQNNGETVTLRAPDEPIQTGSNTGQVPYIVVDHVKFNNSAPWPTEPDGTGVSLERVDPRAYGNDVANWRKSSAVGGTPGTPSQPTEPFTDNDHDGLDDHWEITYFGSTNHPHATPEADGDNDGMDSFSEYIAGTNPTNAGSRFVMELSTVEISEKTHYIVRWNSVSERVYDVLWTPLLESGFQLLETGITSPRNSYTDTVHNASSSGFYRVVVRKPMPDDLDADGLPDDWETHYFSTVAASASMDSDGDRLSNIGEYIAGTDPTNAASVLRFTRAETTPAGFVLEWSAVTGRVYSVLWTDRLGTPFRPLEMDITAPQNSCTDTVHAAEDQGFYDLRVKRLP